MPHDSAKPQFSELEVCQLLPLPALNVMIALLETPLLSGILRLTEPPSVQIRGTKAI